MELAEVEFTARLDSVVDRAEVICSALGAVGVAESSMREFAEATEVIVHKESAWKPDAVVALGEGKTMDDGAPYAAQRGLTQLTPWAFAEHHVPGTSVCIYDPVANIAAAWRLVGVTHGVDLETGRGLAEFMADVHANPGAWFAGR